MSERSSWHWTTIPVGMCERRHADWVELTCWPPGPPAENLSTRVSVSSFFMSIAARSSTSGRTITAAALVWTRPWDSVSGTYLDAREIAREGFPGSPTPGITGLTPERVRSHLD